VGLNAVFGRFRYKSDVIENANDGDFKSGASADSATQAQLLLTTYSILFTVVAMKPIE
jgi:hypothetical protein